MAETVMLEDGWSATPTWVAPQGYILVVTLKNGRDGRVEESVRFDAGKLIFLDRRPGVPEFETETRQRLANAINRRSPKAPAA